jgi:hypothetical protein
MHTIFAIIISAVILYFIARGVMAWLFPKDAA